MEASTRNRLRPAQGLARKVLLPPLFAGVALLCLMLAIALSFGQRDAKSQETGFGEGGSMVEGGRPENAKSGVQTFLREVAPQASADDLQRPRHAAGADRADPRQPRRPAQPRLGPHRRRRDRDLRRDRSGVAQVKKLADTARINAVVLLTDGEDTDQLSVQRKMQAQLESFYDQTERVVVELDTMRGSLLSVSASTDVANQRRLAGDVRALRDELGSLAEGMSEAFEERAA